MDSDSFSDYDSDTLNDVQKMEDRDRVISLIKSKAGNFKATREAAVKRRNEKRKEEEDRRIKRLLRVKATEIKESRETAVKRREENVRRRMAEQVELRAKVLENTRQLEKLTKEIQALNEAAAGKDNLQEEEEKKEEEEQEKKEKDEELLKEQRKGFTPDSLFSTSFRCLDRYCHRLILVIMAALNTFVFDHEQNLLYDYNDRVSESSYQGILSVELLNRTIYPKSVSMFKQAYPIFSDMMTSFKSVFGCYPIDVKYDSILYMLEHYGSNLPSSDRQFRSLLRRLARDFRGSRLHFAENEEENRIELLESKHLYVEQSNVTPVHNPYFLIEHDSFAERPTVSFDLGGGDDEK